MSAEIKRKVIYENDDIFIDEYIDESQPAVRRFSIYENRIDPDFGGHRELCELRIANPSEGLDAEHFRCILDTIKGNPWKRIKYTVTR